MKKILMIALVLSSVISSCKKEKETTPAVDPRDKFVGTFKGEINIVIPPEFESLIDPTTPRKFNVTYVYSKNPTISNELLINAMVDPNIETLVQITNPLSATLNGSSYTYKEFSLTLGPLEVKCTGTGTINADGKSITEAGNWNYIPGVNGTWTSSLTKQ